MKTKTGGIKNRGFASMTRERRKELATRGGKVSQGKDPETGELKGNGYHWSLESSRKAIAAKAAKKALRLTQERED